VALSRTTNPYRVVENLTVFDFELREDKNGGHPGAGKAQHPDRQSVWIGFSLECFLIIRGRHRRRKTRTKSVDNGARL